MADWTTLTNFIDGVVVTAARLNEIVSNLNHLFNRGMTSQASSSGTLALSTTPTDVPGATTSFTMADAGWVTVHGNFDMNVTASGVGAAVGSVVVDGVSVAGAVWAPTTTGRGPAPAFNRVQLTAGAHTAKCQASKTAAGGTATAESASILVVRVI